MKLFFIIVLCLVIHNIEAQIENFNYPPDSLVLNTDAILIKSNTTYEIKSDKKYVQKVKNVLTIYNKAGLKFGNLKLFYDNNSEILNFEANLYDENKKLVGKYDSKDLEDYSSYSSYTLFSDSRVKTFSVIANSYPITLSYEYEIKNNGIVGIDSWFPAESYGISVLRAQLSIDIEEGVEIKTKDLNYNFNKKTTSNKKGNALNTWVIENLKALPYHNNISDYTTIFPGVFIAPMHIKFEGTEGDFSSWKNYGQWVNSLLENRDQLPSQLLQKLEVATSGMSDYKRIKFVYNFVQDNTRYVNIALGLGGFQPIKASEVDEYGYGDCKALSNFTKSILNSLGIEAYYTEIGNGNNQKLKFIDFVTANQTNHVIVMVPNNGDTIWLECTNQKMPFGYIGNSNYSRNALIINDEGGVIVRTPSFSARQNQRISHSIINIENSGLCTFNLYSEYKNQLFEELFPLIYEKENLKRIGILQKLSNYDFEFSDFMVKDNSKENAQSVLVLSGEIKNYLRKAGSSYILETKSLMKYPFSLNFNEKRTLDYYIPYGMTLNDTLEIVMPSNYYTENLPKEMKFHNSIGVINQSYHFNMNTIVIVRSVKMMKGTYTGNSFKDIQNYFDFLRKINSGNLVFSLK